MNEEQEDEERPGVGLGGREEKGYFNNIVRELMIEDTAGYREMMRMTHVVFLAILSRIEPDITPRQVTGGHKVIRLPSD